MPLIPTKYLYRLTALAGALIFLGACGPVYKTDYIFQPPASLQGKMCVNQCTQIKQSCFTNCNLRNESCFLRAEREARKSFRTYVKRQNKKKKAIEKTQEDFYRPRCKTSSCQVSCNGNHRICYKDCGGRIGTVTRCTAFCK